MIRNLIVQLALLTLLAGCSMFGDKDNAEPPAELEKFEEQVSLKRVWSRSTGSGADEQLVNLVPTVSADTVFVADRNGSVHAYQLENGKPLWSSKTGVAISAGPGIGEGLVLVGSSNGVVVALSVDDGSELWRANVTSEVLSVPQVEEGVVIIQTVDGNLAGLEATSGERRWLSERSVPVLTLRGTSTPLVRDGVVLAGFANGKIAAFEVDSGRIAWEAPVAVAQGRSELQRIVDVDARSVVHQGVLYVTSFQGNMAAVSLSDGRIIWNREMSSYAGIAVDYSQVYVSDADSELWALDRDSGASLWKLDKLRKRAMTGPVAIDDYVGVGDFEGYLHLMSRVDGRFVARVKVDSDGILATPVALDEQLLVLGAGGKLVLFDIRALDS